MVKGQQWLELIELGLLLLVFLTMLEGLFSGNWQVPFVFLWLALCVNIFNRTSLQHRQKRQAMGAVKGLERRIEAQIQQLATQLQQSSNIKSSIAQLNTKEQMQDYLGSLEKSLTNVVQYLNQEALDERLRNLEQELLRLQQENLEWRRSPEALLPQAPVPAEKTAVIDPWDNPQQAPIPVPTPAPTQPKQVWQPIYELAAHKDCVSALGFSDDHQLLASGSWDRQLKVWQVADGKQISQIAAHNQGLLNLKFMDGFMDRLLDGLLDGEIKPYAIASSSFEPEVKLWHLDVEHSDIPELELKQTFAGHLSAVYAIATTPDGTLISGSHDQTIRQWQAKDGELLNSNVDSGDQIQAIACAPEGNLFVTGGTEGLLKFWRTDNHQLIGSLGNDQPEAIAAIAIRSDGRLFVSGGENGIIYLWQLDLNTLGTLPETVPCFTLPAHNKPITHLIFNPQGDFLVSSSVDGSIKIWQLGVELPLATLSFNDVEKGEHARLLALALSGDGSTLAAGGSDGKIKVWRQG